MDRLRASLADPAEVSETDGVRRWRSNGTVIGPHVFADAFVACPAVQREAYRAELDAFAARERAHPRPLSEEELWEMRSEFGRGTTVVNVLTGRRTRL